MTTRGRATLVMAVLLQVDDLEFVQWIIQRTTADLAIDPDRIYIAGFSAGAAMRFHIACEAPELIAAIGAVS